MHNILLVKESLIFCYFRKYGGLIGTDNTAKAAMNIEILLISFDVEITGEVREKIDKYAADKTEEHINELIAAVSAASE
jgi:hypothetical protein